jgi:putative ABC transport system ATP-binding protein
MSSADIELRSVRKVYLKDRIDIPVLEGLDLEVSAGEFVVLMGPSGSGKSTLLHLIGGLDSPTAGSVPWVMPDWNRCDRTRTDELAKPPRHFIFQMYHLVPVLTAAQNVELPCFCSRCPPPNARARWKRRNVVGWLIAPTIGLISFPGGQEQRVAIARAIVTDPDVILADELTGDLDAKTSEEILNLLNVLNADMGKTILMVTHDPRAASHGQRTVHLDKGVLEREEINSARPRMATAS